MMCSSAILGWMDGRWTDKIIDLEIYLAFVLTFFSELCFHYIAALAESV